MTVINSKFSQFPLASTLLPTDIFVGLRSGANYRFNTSSLLKMFYQALAVSTALLPTNSSYLFELTVAGVVLSDASGLSAYDNGFYITLKNTSAGTCAFTPKAGEFIDGAASLTIASGAAVTIAKLPTQWSVI